MNKCPLCDFEEDTAWGQVLHMNTKHPEEVAARLRENGFYDEAVKFEEEQGKKAAEINRVEDILLAHFPVRNLPLARAPSTREIAVKIVEGEHV